VRKARTELEAKRVPMLGISAAFSFLIMLFNIPAPSSRCWLGLGPPVSP
jgi:ABC-type Co2+ transport system permease subunit